MPKNKAKNIPNTRKGPNGTSLFNDFFLAIISPKPIIAPEKKAEKRATKILGKPKKRPIKRANFTSPKPSHLPLDIRKIVKKNREVNIAEKI